jgi:Xaa-Pro aminopeptidase
MGHRNAPDWEGRLSALRARWATQGSAACVISSLTNIHYLTGLPASAGLLVQDAQHGAGAALLLDGRYTTVANELQAEGALGPVEVVLVDGAYDDALGRALQQRGPGRVVFESEHTSVATLSRWQQRFPAEWHGSEALVEPLRLRKDAWELDLMRRAGAMISAVANRLHDWVAEGRTERDIAADIDRALILAGFSKPAFDTIVASGPNSARPHARPGARRLTSGDLVVLDFGGVLDGYCVDLTRMAAVGRVAPEAEALYAAVRSAHAAALEVIGAGVPAQRVDAAARQVLEHQGLGAAFVHGTGHGLGLQVHEAPRVSRLSPPGEVLEAGMVCTVEPGAYVPGLGGARLEDDVVVTDTGAELLTTASRDLLHV